MFSLLKESLLICTLIYFAIGSAIVALLAAKVSYLSSIVALIVELILFGFVLNRRAVDQQSAVIELQTSVAALEQQIAAQTLELEQVRSIADVAHHAKSEFLANMSHELRTPLNGILGYTQILLRDRTATPQQKDRFNVIYQCGTHLLTLINDVLDLSKIEAHQLELHPQDFHLETFLNRIIETCRVQAEQKNITFTFQALNSLPIALHADEKRLRQVLINLLGNAIKFTDQGGVTFKVSVLSGTNLPYRLRFQIDDTGVGMTPEQLEKIFLPFEQVCDKTRRAEGTGLGLAISSQILELMASELHVESTIAQGSSFWFEVEFAEAKEWKDAHPQTALGIIGYKGNRRKILIVDDRWENRSVILNLLQPLGFELIEAGNGQEGLTQAKLIQPDLIITDIVMPGMNGLEMVQHLRSMPQFETLPMIVSSASILNFDRQAGRSAGCTDSLPKPVQTEELLEQLQTYLNLTWIDESPTSTVEMAIEQIPPAEELRQLRAAARIGDIRGIQTEARRFEANYPDFVEKILQLAEAFDDQAILKLLNQFLFTA